MNSSWLKKKANQNLDDQNIPPTFPSSNERLISAPVISSNPPSTFPQPNRGIALQGKSSGNKVTNTPTATPSKSPRSNTPSESAFDLDSTISPSLDASDSIDNNEPPIGNENDLDENFTAKCLHSEDIDLSTLVTISATFQYSIEYRGDTIYSIIPKIEEGILGVGEKALSCISSAVTDEERKIAEDTGVVVELSSLPIDTVNDTAICLPSLEVNSSCTVITGKMTIVSVPKSQKHDEYVLKLLAAAKGAMETNQLISAESPDLIKLDYIGSDPAETTGADSDHSIFVTGIWKPTEVNKSNIIIWICIGAVFVFGSTILCCIGRRRKKKQAEEANERKKEVSFFSTLCGTHQSSSPKGKDSSKRKGNNPIIFIPTKDETTKKKKKRGFFGS